MVRGNIWKAAECDTLTTTLKDTVYTDILGDLTPPQVFRYKVTAYYNGIPDQFEKIFSGNTGGSDGKVWGGGYYTTPLDNRYWNVSYTIDQALGTFIDANEDGQKWGTTGATDMTPTGGKSFTVLGMTNQNNRDDWFITPPIKVKAGHIYTVNDFFGDVSGSFKETMGVFGGYEPSLAGMTDTIADYATFQGVGMFETKGTFTAAKDGMYYLGFHAKTEYRPGFLNFYGYQVDAGYPAGTPDYVADLVSQNDYNGSLDVNISFKAPAVDVAGTALTALSKIELTRDGAVVNTWTAPAPGAALTFVDKPEAVGYHDYVLTAYTDKGAGRPTLFKTHAGINQGTQVEGITATAQGDTQLTASWQPVTKDIEGQDLNPAYVTYNLYWYNTDGFTPIAENVAATSGTFTVTEAGIPTYGRLVVRANTPGGESVNALTDENIQVGAATTMPWGESFKLGIFETLSGREELDLKETDPTFRTWNPAVSSDGDCGSGYYTRTNQYGAKKQGHSTPLIHIAGVNPRARMYVGASNGSNNYGEIAVNDGTGWKVLGKLTQTEAAATGAAWAPLEVSLDEYDGKDVHVRFCIYNVNYLSTEFDNLMVYNADDANTGVQSVTTDYNDVIAGSTNNIYVKLRNFGTKASGSGGGISVNNCELRRDGKKIGAIKVPAIDQYGYAVLTFTDDVPTGVETVTYTAHLTMAGSYAGDNDRTVTFKAVPSNRPRPTELAGNGVNGNAELAWTPASTEGALGDPVTETFEQYGSWTYENIGDWTLIDGDGQPNYGLMGPDMPIAGIATSWFVGDQTLANWIVATFNCYPFYQGDKALCSRYTVDRGKGDYFTDDWAISPELSGHAQTVLLIGNGDPDQTNFYASSTGKDIDDFSLLPNPLSTKRVFNDTNMHKLQLDLPEGTKYFAIRNHSLSGGWGATFAIQDVIRYVPALKDMDILGYNVYCDGEKVNTDLVTGTTYTHANPTGSHTYYVKAVTSKGESEPSNAVTFDVSGIGDITAEGAVETDRFNAVGQRVDRDYRGVVIVKYSDGSSRKQVIR